MVLIVDDDDATRDSLRFLLECEGMRVEDFASGSQLVADPSWPPRTGCMILDVHMPGLSGLDVLEKLRSSNSSVPVVVVTGHPTSANRRRAMAAGALDVLEKPLADGRIVELVRQALDGENHPG